MPSETPTARCTWCGRPVAPAEGYRLSEPAGDRGATFCRLEHTIPWSIQGARFEPGTPGEPRAVVEGHDRCAHCGEPLPDTLLLLVRHRGEHRIADAFCSVDHLAAWAKAGGRWR